jgi:membrane protease YdiL (CAAX protease family)
MNVNRSPTSQLVWFFILAFIIAWGTWIPALMWPGVPKPIALIGLFGPALAAAAVGGRAGIAELLARVRKWRFDTRWYALAILLMPALYLGALLINHVLFGLETQSLWIGSPPYFLIASFVWLIFITSGEEIGWRGFALPRLLGLGWTPARASLLLGLVWGAWHLPLYLVPGQSSFPYPLFLALTVGQSLIYTALYFRSGGSVVPAMLLHAGTDFGPRLLHIDRFGATVWATFVVLVWLTAAALMRSGGHRDR